MNTQQITKLRRIISLAEKLIATSTNANSHDQAGTRAVRRTSTKRTRRSGKQLVQFRKMLMAERKKGVAVATLARKHGVSTAYIYML